MTVLRRPRILIVGDDPVHLGLYELLLQGGGFEGIPLEIRVSGLESMPEEGIDLVLLDAFVSPPTSILDVAQAAKRRYPNRPLLFLSDALGPRGDLGAYVTDQVGRRDAERLLRAVRLLLVASGCIQDEGRAREG